MDTSKGALALGRIARYTVSRITAPGAYLSAGEVDVLLPNRYLPAGTAVGDEIEAFVYHDNEGRLVATTLHPLVVVGEVASLEAISSNEQGAFMQWGIHRDLFVPIREQHTPILAGQRYPVIAYIDDVSGRITGSTKLGKHLAQLTPLYEAGDAVRIMVAEPHALGWRVVIDNQCLGMLYQSDMPNEPLAMGDFRTAYIKRIRPDGKVDLSLAPIGRGRALAETQALLELLEQNGGMLPVGDKSSTEEIRALTGLTKRAFKQAAGALYKAGLATPTPHHLTLDRKRKQH